MAASNPRQFEDAGPDLHPIYSKHEDAEMHATPNLQPDFRSRNEVGHQYFKLVCIEGMMQHTSAAGVTHFKLAH